MIDYYADNHKGGFPPYTFEWSNGSTNPYTISNLAAGVYTLTMTDSEGCTIEKDHVVPSGEGQPSVTVDTEKTCENTSDGEIEFYIYVEEGPYDLDWDTSLDDNITVDSEEDNGNSVFVTISDLAVGAYCITVTDLGNSCIANVCGIVKAIEITEEFSIKSSFVKPSCNFGPNGSIFIIPDGNIGNVDYQWSNGATSYLNSNLMAGSYSVTMTDQCGSSINESFIVEGFDSNINVEGFVKCVNTNTKQGTIELTVTGSNAPYTYKWSNGDNSKDITVTESGIYKVRVTDKNGCYIDESFNVGDTDGDLSASVNMTDINQCSQSLEILVSAVVNGGVEPYSFEWKGGGSESIKILNPIFYDNPKTLKYSVTITDACNQEIIVSNDFFCNDICPDDCIEFYRSGKPECVDVCGDAAFGLFLDNFNCDEFRVKSNCDDGIIRTFYWNSLTTTSGTTTVFEGEDVIKGFDEKNINVAGPGYAHTWVKNEQTGCIKQISLYVPKKCFSLWNWLWECKKNCGLLSGEDTPPQGSDSECLEWSISDGENCDVVWKCTNPPDNDIDDIIDSSDEYCVAKYDGETEVSNIELLYESCDCDWIGNLYIDTGNFNECGCKSLNFAPIDTITTNIKCRTNPIDIYFDKAQNSFVYLTSEYETNSLVQPYIANSKSSINANITLSPIKATNGKIKSVQLDNNRNIILHILTDVGEDKIITYDTTGVLIWEYKVEKSNALNTYINTNSKNETKIVSTYSTYIKEVLFSNGILIESSSTPVQGDILYTSSSNTFLSIRPSSNSNNIISHNSEQQELWNTVLPSEILIKKYFIDVNDNIVIFYNHENEFVIDGKLIPVSDKVSSGVLVLSESGLFIKNYSLKVSENFIITDVEQGLDNNFSMVGYYSNNRINDITDIYNNSELCSFIIGFSLDKTLGIKLRNQVVEHEVEISVFPNPTNSSNINVGINTPNISGNIKVHDIYGQLIFSREGLNFSNKTNLSLDLKTKVKSGVYTLSFEGETVNKSIKFVLIN